MIIHNNTRAKFGLILMLMSMMMIIVTMVVLLMMMIYIYITNQQNTKQLSLTMPHSNSPTLNGIHIYTHIQKHTHINILTHTLQIKIIPQSCIFFFFFKYYISPSLFILFNMFKGTIICFCNMFEESNVCVLCGVILRQLRQEEAGRKTLVCFFGGIFSCFSSNAFLFLFHHRNEKTQKMY